MSGTTITGNFKDCGPGQKPQIDFVCQGTVCPSFGKFPQGTVVDTGNDLDSLSYKSDANCESVKSNYFGSLLFQQAQPEIDARVSQEQNITLPKCKGLHVQSDGTSAGTHVDSIDRTNEPDCVPLPPPSSTPIIIPQSSSIPVGAYILSGLGGSASSSQAETPATTAIVTPNPTESQPIQYTGNKASQNRPHIGVLLVCFLMISFLIQGSTAYLLPDGNRHVEVHAPVMGPDTLKRTTYNMHFRALSNNIRAFADEFGGYVAGKVDAMNGNGEVFADNLISETLSTICEGFFSGAVVEAFTPSVVDGCVTAVYTANAIAAPEVELLSVFGASMFCNYVVAQAFPVAEQFSSEACQGLEDLIKKPPVSTVVPPPVSSVVPPPSTKEIPPPITTKPPPISVQPPPITHEPSSIPTHKPTFHSSELSMNISAPPVYISLPSIPMSILSIHISKLSDHSSIPISHPTQPAKPCNGADLMSDVLNCGQCGHQCSEFQECNQGCCAHHGRYGEDCQGISPNTTISEWPSETTFTSWSSKTSEKSSALTTWKSSWSTKTSEKDSWSTKTSEKESAPTTWKPTPPITTPKSTDTEPSQSVETSDSTTTHGRKLWGSGSWKARDNVAYHI